MVGLQRAACSTAVLSIETPPPARATHDCKQTDKQHNTASEYQIPRQHTPHTRARAHARTHAHTICDQDESAKEKHFRSKRDVLEYRGCAVCNYRHTGSHTKASRSQQD